MLFKENGPKGIVRMPVQCPCALLTGPVPITCLLEQISHHPAARLYVTDQNPGALAIGSSCSNASRLVPLQMTFPGPFDPEASC